MPLHYSNHMGRLQTMKEQPAIKRTKGLMGNLNNFFGKRNDELNKPLYMRKDIMNNPFGLNNYG